MDTTLLKPIKGVDVGIKKDFWGNQEVYLTKIKYEGVQNNENSYKEIQSL